MSLAPVYMISEMYDAMSGISLKIPTGQHGTATKGTLTHHSYGHWIIRSGTVPGGGKLNGCKTLQISAPPCRVLLALDKPACLCGPSDKPCTRLAAIQQLKCKHCRAVQSMHSHFGYTILCDLRTDSPAYVQTTWVLIQSSTPPTLSSPEGGEWRPSPAATPS